MNADIKQVKEMMKNRLRFGMVGAGSIAQAYAQAFDNCETAELVAVADIEGQRRESTGGRSRVS